MKTKTITTPSCTLLVCELPEDSFSIWHTKADTRIISSDTGDIIGVLPMWMNLIGCLPEVTEEQIEEIIELHPYDFHQGSECPLYWVYGQGEDELFTESAKESFYSLLESEGVYFENPLGEPPLPICTSDGIDVDRYTKTVQYWQSAQEQVWDRNRTYIFK